MKKGSPGTLKRGVAALLGLLVLASCTVVVDEGYDRPSRPGPGPRPGPEFCTREYDPVCGERRGDSQTFSNACEADRAGYRVVRRGECRRSDGRPGGPGGWGGGGGRDEPRFCTREYRPVCAQRGREVRSFGNACEADAAGYRILGGGPC